MSLPVKAGIGLVTVGTIGGVSYGIVAYSKDQGTKISKLVEEEYKYILLDTKDHNKVDAQWKVNEKNDKDFFELEGWKKESTTDLKDKLREKCQELSKSKIEKKNFMTKSQVIAEGLLM